MKEAPYFPFWAKDWRSSESVQLMSLAERGAFMELLAVAWLSSEEPCTIPSDEETIARLIHASVREWRKIAGRVLGEFAPVESGRLRNAKLYRVYCEMQAKHDKLSQGGKRGAAKRWPGDAEATGQANGVANGVAIDRPIAVRVKAKDRERTTTTSPRTAAREERPSFDLSPYLATYGEFFPDSDPPRARYGRTLKRLEGKHGREETLRRWRICLVRKGTFATPEELSAHWSSYATEEIATRPIAFTGPPVVDGWMSEELERMTRPNRVA